MIADPKDRRPNIFLRLIASARAFDHRRNLENDRQAAIDAALLVEHPMTIEMVKTVFTYLIALIIIVGTGVLLRFPPPGIPPETLLTFLGVQVGFVMAYVFQERATSNAASNQPTVTHTSGQPPTTTVSPSTLDVQNHIGD